MSIPPVVILLILLGYALGSVPFGLIIGKRAGLMDIRKAGSGNIGATNVGRLLGKKWGILTLFCDITKAVIPLGLAFYGLRGMAKMELWVSLIALAVFIGHLYPIYLKFKGGKGVATALGVFIVLIPGAAFSAFPVFITAAWISGYVSVGSLTAAAAMPLLAWLFSHSKIYTMLAAVMAVLIWLKHKDNIRRMLNGSEKSWRKG
ncbi:MAG: glycerol-3-phosphate 1-O-acyltransferase PlsY [Desulfovibrionales bacterium]|nr:glycerol-3-phosphate 1-O-acyltransferase PlsY [Desulfovibrionales bacterium]